MKFTLSWLKEYIDTADATLEEILDQLTSIGIEVEKVEDRAKEFEKYIVGEVIECNKHPDADKLNVTTVDTGTEKIQVVCGAPNCRLGLKGIFAPSGAYVPGLNLTLKKANIRGIESNGMLCSESELCLSDSHEGIIELPEDAVVGTPAAEILGLDDPIIEIEVTPNRGDWAGIYGIARDLGATNIGIFKPLEIKKIDGSFTSLINIKVNDEAVEACPLFIGRHFKGLKNGPSPKWLQDRLRAIGLRPISALVDITNYFCMGLNRPLHVFDAGKVKGDLNIRFSHAGEEIEGLNDKSYKLDNAMTAICDDNGVQALAGVVGAVSTGCTEDTTEVFLEVAWFDPVRTAKTGRKLQINSDARYRFERAVDPVFTHDGVELATQMILDLCGGEASELVIAGKAPDNTRIIEFKTERTLQLGGCDIPDNQQQEILLSLGCDVNTDKDVWLVKTPSWRPDLEGSADLVEEILRINGFDKIEAIPMPRPETYTPSPLTPLQKNISKSRRVLAGLGLSEAITWAFMSSDKAELFGANDEEAKKSITLTNPISSEWDMMRPSILPNLIDAAGRNEARGYSDVALFEVGGCYKTAEYDGQITVASGIRVGSAVPRHWAAAQRPVDAMDAKADVMEVLKSLGAPAENAPISTDAPDWFHPGRSGTVRLGSNVMAYFGEIHPAVLEEMGIDFPVCGFEIFLENLPTPKKKASTARKAIKTSQFQPVKRDFAFIVDKNVITETMVRAAKAADKQLITSVEIFDVYEGKGVDDDKKSIAISVTLQPMEATLTEDQIEEVSQKIIQNISGKTGGLLRG